MKDPLNLVFAILYLAALALLAHPLGQALPRRLFREDRFPFASFRWEQNGTVYKKLWIEKWKDILPDMSRVLSDMIPKKITEATPEQMKLLLSETCRAEAVHWGEIAAGLGCLAICPSLAGVILTALWALFGNLPFILIQRYNRPRLKKLYDRLAALERRKER